MIRAGGRRLTLWKSGICRSSDPTDPKVGFETRKLRLAERTPKMGQKGQKGQPGGTA